MDTSQKCHSYLFRHTIISFQQKLNHSNLSRPKIRGFVSTVSILHFCQVAQKRFGSTAWWEMTPVKASTIFCLRANSPKAIAPNWTESSSRTVGGWWFVLLKNMEIKIIPNYIIPKRMAIYGKWKQMFKTANQWNMCKKKWNMWHLRFFWLEDLLVLNHPGDVDLSRLKRVMSETTNYSNSAQVQMFDQRSM